MKGIKVFLKRVQKAFINHHKFFFFSTNSEGKSKLEVTFDVQEKLEQILFFTGVHWPKEHLDVEITLAYQANGNTKVKVKVCTLSPNQR